VFLDEIEDASRALQAKLLRLLENREVKPLNQPAEQVDVAVVAATNRSLDGMADEKSFRNDLRMRFERPVLRLPPLRERREDIFAIAMAWLTEAGTPLDPRTLKVEAVEWLLRAHWDGNVRELGHALEEIVGAGQPATLALPAVQKAVALDGRVRRALTNAAAHESMRRHKDNQSAAARELGVPLPTLRRKLGMV
jgi:transcriptional regulator with PAS, ATPase and Fis domain